MCRRLFVICLGGAVLVGQAGAQEVPQFVPGSWTLAIMPDTHYGLIDNVLPWVDAQTQWLAANKHTYDIRFVLHEGDMTHRNDDPGWTAARGAFTVLDDADIPYAIALGNHDCGTSGVANDHSSMMSYYFTVASQQAKGTFGGTFEPNKLDNSYHLFSAGGTDYVVLATEFGPRDGVVAWADSVLTQYSDRTGILVSHAYLYSDDTRYDWATKGSAQNWNPHSYLVAGLPGGVNDGQELWNNLVKKHANMKWVFSGHVLNDGAGRLDSAGESANTVHQILANFQLGVDGLTGREGYMRLMEFRPDGLVQVKTYSPYLDSYLTADAHQFLVRDRLSGDANEDHLVDMQDFYILRAHFGQVGGWAEGNFNDDIDIDIQDFYILKAHFGQHAPEPAALGLLALGAAGLLRSRSRRLSRHG